MAADPALQSSMTQEVHSVRPADVAAATGGFHVVAEIGEGGFGKVYRAMVNHRPVACKVRQKQVGTSEQLLFASPAIQVR